VQMVSSDKKYFYNIGNDVYWSNKYCKQIFVYIKLYNSKVVSSSIVCSARLEY